MQALEEKSRCLLENPAHPDYLLPRPDILSRYFPDGHAPRVTMETNFFLKEKPENGLRLVVQGGSTATGFPYGLGEPSLAGMLTTGYDRPIRSETLK